MFFLLMKVLLGFFFYAFITIVYVSSIINDEIFIKDKSASTLVGFYFN